MSFLMKIKNWRKFVRSYHIHLKGFFPLQNNGATFLRWEKLLINLHYARIILDACQHADLEFHAFAMLLRVAVVIVAGKRLADSTVVF